MLFDEHNCMRAVICELFEHAHQHVAYDGRETFQRLVQQQDCRSRHQRPCDRQHLLFAARQLAAAVSTALGEARKERIGLLEPRVAALRGEQVFFDAERTENIACLRHQPESSGRAPVCRHMRDVCAIKTDGPGVHPGQTHDGGHQS